MAAFRQLLGTIAAAHVPIVLIGTHVDCTVQACTPPPPGAVAQNYTTAWGAALTGLATQYHAGLVLDVQRGLTAADRTDWLHCNARGYRKMATRIEAAVWAGLGSA